MSVKVVKKNLMKEIRKMENKNNLENYITLCKVKDRTEVFCRYSYYLIMNNIECPYYKYNINPILSGCDYLIDSKFIRGYN